MSNQTAGNNKRIAKNTLLLYFRMLITLVVSLYTSRVVLNTLGVDDYGIYNVVGGVVTMFTMLSGSLTAAITRFITFDLGKGDLDKLIKTFSASVTIQVILALIVFVLAETGFLAGSCPPLQGDDQRFRRIRKEGSNSVTDTVQ